MDLQAGDTVGRLAGQTRGVIVGGGVGLFVQQVVDADLQLEAGIQLVADIEVELAIALVLGELVAVRHGIGAEAPPLQAAEPRAEVVYQDAERSDEAGRVGDPRTIQAEVGERRRIALVARLGEGHVGVQLKPRKRMVLG